VLLSISAASFFAGQLRNSLQCGAFGDAIDDHRTIGDEAVVAELPGTRDSGREPKRVENKCNGRDFSPQALSYQSSGTASQGPCQVAEQMIGMRGIAFTQSVVRCPRGSDSNRG
jgi:hypothetical protein